MGLTFFVVVDKGVTRALESRDSPHSFNTTILPLGLGRETSEEA